MLALKEVMEQSSSNSEVLPHLEADLVTCETDFKYCDQVIEVWCFMLCYEFP